MSFRTNFPVINNVLLLVHREVLSLVAASNGRMINETDLKEAVVTYSEVLFSHLPGDFEKKQRNTLIWVSLSWLEIRTKHRALKLQTYSVVYCSCFQCYQHLSSLYIQVHPGVLQYNRTNKQINKKDSYRTK